MQGIIDGVIANAIYAAIASALLIAAFLIKNVNRLLFHIRIIKSGFINFFPNRDSYTKDRGISLEEYLTSINSDLIYIGHWLSASIEQRNTFEALKEILKSGKSITLIFLSKDLPEHLEIEYAKFFGNDIKEFKNEINSGWATLLKWHSNLGTDEKSKIFILEHKNMICHSAFLLDSQSDKGKILIDQKIWGLKRKNSFGFELSKFNKRKKADKDLYERYYDSLNLIKSNSSRII